MFLSPVQILKELPLPERAQVGDFGAGSGQYALALAERLGSQGTIYALDAFGPNLDLMRQGAEKYGSAFYTLESDLNRHIPLKTNLLNVAIVANTLHQLTDRERFVSELARVLEPGGKALVVDWAGSFRNMGPPEGSVVTPGEAVRLFRSAGFSTGEMLPAGTHHFAFVATSHTS
ncbi:MAG: class I SAM-dependent methyltransferase [bacterium]|nr:class I SAM-dependent methyltransferase [bacterium]